MKLHGEKLKRKPLIGIFGLTFKEDIDDIRESPALFITEKLIEEGFKVVVCEPHLKKYKDLDILSCSDILEMADILVFLVAHSSFRNLNIKDKKFLIFAELIKFEGPNSFFENN